MIICIALVFFGIKNNFGRLKNNSYIYINNLKLKIMRYTVIAVTPKNNQEKTWICGFNFVYLYQ